MALEPSTAESKLDIEEEKASTERPPSEDVEKVLDDPPTTTDATEQPEYPPMRKVILIMVSLYLATFLVSLVSYTEPENTFGTILGLTINQDRTIIATAIPSEFPMSRSLSHSYLMLTHLQR